MKCSLFGLAFAIAFAHLSLASAAPSEEDLKKVVKLSATAVVAYDKGKYDQALSLYQQAHQLWPNPKLSLAIVKCLQALKRYKEALQIVERGLKEKPKAITRSRLESKRTFLKNALSKGRLRLRVTPSGAQIKINGQVKGTAPLEELELPSGKHQLEISHPNHAKIVQGIDVKGGETLRLSFTLQALTGSLSITSSPSGADVTIDGKSWGKTPLNNLNLPMGSHSVIIRYKGYQPTQKVVNISAQRSESIAVVLKAGSAPSPAPQASGRWYTSWPGWTVVALGVVAGAIGAVLLVQSNQTHTQVQNFAKDPSSTTLSQKELDDRWNQANLEQRLSYGLIGAAGGLVLVGVILFAAGVGTSKAPAQATSWLPKKPRHSAAKAHLLYSTP